MTSLRRVVMLITAANTLVLAALLLFVVHESELATGVAAATTSGLVIGLLAAASVLPQERVRSADENARLGIAFAGSGGVLVLAAVALALLGDVRSSGFLVVIGVTIATFGAGMLNAARMLRRIPSLISPEEEPRAVALAANAMPGPARRLVVATDDRIVWADGRQLREVHGVRLTDVERFDTDYKTGTLSLIGAGEALQVKPVPRRELEKFERLLGSGEPMRVPT